MERMLFVVNRQTKNVSLVGDFTGRYAGSQFTDNSQHAQLPGHILANCLVDENRIMEINLMHPETGPQTGHWDLGIRFRTSGEVSFIRYSGNERVETDRQCRQVYPDGLFEACLVVNAIERYFQNRHDYTLQIAPFITEMIENGLAKHLLFRESEPVTR